MPPPAPPPAEPALAVVPVRALCEEAVEAERIGNEATTAVEARAAAEAAAAPLDFEVDDDPAPI